MNESEVAGNSLGQQAANVASLIQDPRNGGGVGTVNGWYRRWMGTFRPGESREIFLDESGRSFDFTRRLLAADLRRSPLARMIPRLQVPPFVAARSVSHRLIQDFSEAHVIGGVAMHGYVVKGRLPMIIWMGTTIGDERRATLENRDLGRRLLHSLTLPALEHLEAATLASATRILSQSRHTADCLRSLGVASSRIEVLPVPIDTDVFHPNGARRRGMLFVGRAHDVRKNFGMVIRLLGDSDLAKEEGLDVVSGADPRPRIPYGLKRFVRWHGNVSDISAYFRRAKLLVLTSHQEGLGIVVFEALASGTPVLALRCGGPDTFLMASGGGETHHDYAGLRSSLDRYLRDDGLLQDRGRAGRAWVEQHMSARAFLSDPSLFRL